MAERISTGDGRTAAPKSGRILGLDVGSDRIGVALSDETGRIAGPHGSVQARAGLEAAAREIASLCGQHGVGAVVVGLPLSLEGGEGGESARRARRLGAMIAEQTGLPVIYWDERFTTAEAERLLISADVRRRARREVVDKVAAALILQGYLDSRS